MKAAIPVLEGAGGAVTDWEGAPMGQLGGRAAPVGDRALLDEALPLLAGG